MLQLPRLAVLSVLFFTLSLVAATASFGQAVPLITSAVDDSQRVVLAGNTRPEATAANDGGPVADDLPLDHMYLQLKRSAAQQQAEDALVDRLHDPNAPEYHQWLTSDQIAAQFGPADEDVQTITGWLTSHGFTVNVVYRANGVIDFSGPASAIREAFQTEIHNLSVNGEPHIANVSDPSIPAALAPAIEGVVSMHDFRPRRTTVRPRPQYYYCCVDGIAEQWVVPGDLATIYNFNPLFAAGVSGQGQTIVVVEDSDVYSVEDWHKFRREFGLAQNFPQGSFRQIHPRPSNNPDNGGPCLDPGVNPDGDDSEASVDAEYASAAAPSAAIVLAACANTNTNFGAFIALQNLLSGTGKPPGIVSISYAESEPVLQAPPPFEAYVNQLYEVAVLQGVSIFVAAGDTGADDTAEYGYCFCAGTSGINVNGLASTKHDVAVGGTDFADFYFNDGPTYWSSTNGRYFNSALSYVPEIPWNDSCASQLITNFLGYSAPYGAAGLCNSARGQLLSNSGGGGGPSQCAYGTPSIYDETGSYGVVGGTCRGFPKPAYQKLVSGNPHDGVRDLPDVSLFAADGVWGHFYVFCDSNPIYAVTCVGPLALEWLGDGGTSFASPIMAGIQALIDQTADGYQGNPNYVLYSLAAEEYSHRGMAACNATLGYLVDRYCIFHDVTLGDSDMSCLPLVVGGITIGTFNCYIPSGTYGVLSLSDDHYEPAYPAHPGWDFATGLGSVNAYNLVKNWLGSRLH